MPGVLRDFLLFKNVHKSYIKNLVDSSVRFSPYTLPNYNELSRDNYITFDAVPFNGGFDWEKTAEGYDFWEDISDEWCDYLLNQKEPFRELPYDFL